MNHSWLNSILFPQSGTSPDYVVMNAKAHQELFLRQRVDSNRWDVNTLVVDLRRGYLGRLRSPSDQRTVQVWISRGVAVDCVHTFTGDLPTLKGQLRVGGDIHRFLP